MKAFVSGRPYWWQWFTILSLDATSVGVAWQCLFSRAVLVQIGWPEGAVLGASIWLAYTADRWIEGWRLDDAEALTQRHYFAALWRWPILIVWLIIFLADLVVAFAFLPIRELEAGLFLLIPVVAYVCSHQFLHRDHPWRVPKEICVALLMVGGVVVFLIPKMPHGSVEFWMLAANFGLLCFCNLVLISLWEREVDDRHDQDSLARRFRRLDSIGRLLPWLTALVSLTLAITASHRAWSVAQECVGVSAILLIWVDRVERKQGRQVARTLADAVLLTPLVPLVAGYWR